MKLNRLWFIILINLFAIGSKAQTRFTDPSIYQNFTVIGSQQGIQVPINLTNNPIDTHNISWRLSPGTLSGITDAIPYANSDLHTANPLWVYQTGTFAITGNQVFSSSAGNNLAYRTDGPAGTANQFAQETVVENATSVSQNHGPCVRVQTASLSGYCLQAANNILRLHWISAGTLTLLANIDGSAPITGDILKIQAIGTILTVYKNSVLLVTITDSNIATGNAGIFSAGNATLNGFSNFQAGGFPNCNVQLDSSVDGVNWVLGGAIPSQSCSILTNSSFQQSNINNYVRVNVTSLSSNQILTITYSGRLSPIGTNGNTGGVSNGQRVSAGQILWVQHTTQGLGNVALYQSLQILQDNGLQNTVTWSVPAGNCNLQVGGYGVGYTIPASGQLQFFNAQLNTGGFPQGSDYLNLYLINQYPPGGSQNTCVAGAFTGPIFTLASGTVGSSYPVSFIGTSAIPMSPWSIPGFTTSITVTNPAAGADWSFAPANITPGSVGGGARTCVQGVSFTFTTSATVANRLPVLVITINGTKIVYPATTAQAASLAQVYSFSPGVTSEQVTTGTTIFHTVPFNNGQLACFNSGLSAATIGTLTTAIQAADQYSNVSVLTQVQQDNN